MVHCVVIARIQFLKFLKCTRPLAIKTDCNDNYGIRCLSARECQLYTPYLRSSLTASRSLHVHNDAAVDGYDNCRSIAVVRAVDVLCLRHLR